MTRAEAMRALEKAGTARNRKVYARHGVTEPMFGVSYAHQRKIARKAGTDQALAEKLWKTGNHDARVLATMVADPEKVKAATLDAWARGLDSYVVTEALAALTARTPHAVPKMRRWVKSRGEWTGQAGWTLVARLAMTDRLDDAELEHALDTIESAIHGAKNRVRYSMNGALIAIGLRNAHLKKRALEAARRIGKVQVDHGQTGCKTPDAARYLRKAASRKAAPRKAPGKAPRKATRKRAGSRRRG